MNLLSDSFFITFKSRKLGSFFYETFFGWFFTIIISASIYRPIKRKNELHIYIWKGIAAKSIFLSF